MSYYRKNRYYSRRKRRYRNTSDEIPPEVMAIAIVITAIIFAIYFIIQWIKENIVTVSIIGILLVIVLVVWLFFYIKNRTKEKKEKNLFEKEQVEKRFNKIR